MMSFKPTAAVGCGEVDDITDGIGVTVWGSKGEWLEGW